MIQSFDSDYDFPTLVPTEKLMADVDLEFIARQNECVLTELRCARDDLRVLSAIVQRHVMRWPIFSTSYTPSING